MLDPNIPLSVKPPTFNPLEAIANAYKLQGMSQEYQKGNIELQQAKQAQQDDLTMRQIMQQHNGDIETALPAMAGKVSTAKWLALQNSWIEQQKNKVGLAKDQAEVADKINESLGKFALGVHKAGDTPEAFNAAVDTWSKAYPHLIPHFAPYVKRVQQDPSSVKAIMDSVLAGTTVGQKEREVAAQETTAESRKQTAQTAADRWQAEKPGVQFGNLVKGFDVQGRTIDEQLAGITNQDQWTQFLNTLPANERAGYPQFFSPGAVEQVRAMVKQRAVPVQQQPEYNIKQNEAKALSTMTDDDWQEFINGMIPDKNSPNYARAQSAVSFYRRKGDVKSAADAVKTEAAGLRSTETAVATAKQTAPIKISVAGASGAAAAGAAKDSGALDIMAEQALAGQFSSRNPQLLTAVYGRAAEIARERGLTARQTVMEQNAAKAAQTAYTTLTKNYETLKPFAEMAERNAQVLEEKAAKVSNLGGSFWNTPLREAQSKFTGNTDVAALVTALMPVRADFARLLNSPTGAGVLGQDVRDEMRSALKEGATLGEIKAALDVFRTDARNRKQEYETALENLKGRTVSPLGGGGGADAGTPGSGLPQYPVPQVFTVKDPRGVVHAFATQQAADDFKRKAGIK